jgi:hypothetical protein
MIASISGRVIELLEDGFVIQTNRGGRCVIATLLPGRDTGLVRGDRVIVYGGPGEAGTFASAAVMRLNWDGSEDRVPASPCDLAAFGKAPPPRRKPWWRFW